METFSKVIAVIRDLVWTAVGLVVLVLVAFVLSGGANGVYPAAPGSGTGSGGSGAAQPAGGAAQAPGSQSGPGAAPAPGGQATPGPGGQQPPAPAGGGAAGAGATSVSGAGTFAGSQQGTAVTGKFSVDAVTGNPASGNVSLTVSFSTSTTSFEGKVSCFLSTGGNQGVLIVGGTITSTTNPGQPAVGSGFAVGLQPGSPGSIAAEAGFDLPAGSGPDCATEGGRLFSDAHPGWALTSGNITIR